MIWKVLTDQPNPKTDFLNALPEPVRPFVSVVLSITPIMMVFPGLFAATTWLERKGLGRIQNRLGPNRVGPFGWFQPIADGLKMLTKEDIVPRAADKVVHFLAPIVLLMPTLVAYAVLPYGRNLVPINLDAGMIFFFAVGASTELSIFMAGWASRNKYSLLGAMRAIAQMISYEIPLILSSVTVIMITGSLSLVAIVQGQGGSVFGLVPRWHVFTPWGVAGFIMFLIASLAESNRSPFDIPEAESELIAGHLTEYSGFKYALFFLAEYLGMFAMCGLAATLFLGGWQCAVCIFGLGANFNLVCHQAAIARFPVHLDSRHRDSTARGSTAELRLELHATHGAAESCGHCGMALHRRVEFRGRAALALAVLRRVDSRALIPGLAAD